MKNLLYKEFRLALHPSFYIFFLFGVLLLIPSWPYFIAFGYIFLAFMNMFFIARANQDIFFTASLPVRKKDMVRARVLTLALMELMQIVVAVPFALLHNRLYPQVNPAGMNVNIAFFGLVFIMYAIFNLVFLPMFYQNAYRAGLPMLVAVLAVSVYVLAANVAVETVPLLKTYLNAQGAGHLAEQLAVLVAGAVVFALLTALTYRISAKKFEKVDL